MKAFLARYHSNGNGGGKAGSAESGAGLVEFALMLPLLFLLIVNVVNFGTFFFTWITIANAARVGADYAMMGGAYTYPLAAGALHRPPQGSQIVSVIANEISTLTNRSSLDVCIKANNNGTIIPMGGTCTAAVEAVPADPSPTAFVPVAIDVTYTYQPFIQFWDFPGLGIHATLPPTAMHRRVITRIVQ